jgi:flavin-dependent dehydrogenase
MRAYSKVVMCVIHNPTLTCRDGGKDVAHMTENSRRHITLPDGATVVVVGGGPAGAFFAIRALRKARGQGKQLNLLILEKKRELHFFAPTSPHASCAGCNYCAGGISPRLADVLRENDLALPNAIIESRSKTIVVHGEWKSVELPVPDGRDMFSVFRGSRPKQRSDRYANFDSYLLSRAVGEGARVITAEVTGIRSTPDTKPLISFLTTGDMGRRNASIEADLAVFSGGVNQSPGMDVRSNPLFQALAKMIPGFHPPKVRRAIICEIQVEEDLLQYIEGEVHFAQYGSKELHIEMSSMIPKDSWMTVVLLGKSVDRADPSEYLQVMKRFLQLPHIRRLLPKKALLTPVCLCHPNMTVGGARNAFGHRVAVIGDMVVSRLYKDGIFSAYLTASALADCVLDDGIDRNSLKKCYWPAVKRLHEDNRYGTAVFLLNRLVFSHQLLSRIFYQALLSERKTQPVHQRRLATVLWRIASGDDTYRRILTDMFRLESVWLILVGGVLVTVRNYLTERVFGLHWGNFGRYPTGVPKEDVEKKRREIVARFGLPPFERAPEFESTYSIRIKADEAAVLHQLGKFGDSDREYFTPRLINVHRTAGNANEAGNTIRYDLFPRWLSFSVVLEKIIESRYFLYRVVDGFAEGGILTFDIDPKKPGGGFLTIYVAFNFPRSTNPFKRTGWSLFKRAFPGFVHDVLWNHSLCKLKHLVELSGADGDE